MNDQRIEQVSGAYHKRAHEFVAAPPGAGPGKVCKHCGARMHVVGRDSHCGAVDDGPPIVATRSDYDPFA